MSRPPGEVDFGGRLSREGQVGPPVIVMVQPSADHPPGVVAAAQFLKVNRLVLQRPPESLDEAIVYPPPVGCELLIGTDLGLHRNLHRRIAKTSPHCQVAH